MPVLVWKHGTTADQARKAVQAEIRRLGFEDHVTWKGNNLTASAGWGTLVNISGRVTKNTLIIDKCSGAFGGTVLNRCRELLGSTYPGGEET